MRVLTVPCKFYRLLEIKLPPSPRATLYFVKPVTRENNDGRCYPGIVSYVSNGSNILRSLCAIYYIREKNRNQKLKIYVFSCYVISLITLIY